MIAPRPVMLGRANLKHCLYVHMGLARPGLVNHPLVSHAMAFSSD